MTGRIFTFYFSVANAARSTKVFPVLKGPVLISHLRIQSDRASFDQSAELGLGTTEELGVPLTNARPYDATDFQQLIRTAGAINAAHTIGYIIPSTFALEIFAGLPIYRENPQIVLAILNNTAAVGQYVGYMKVWEEVPEDLLRCFLDP